MTIKAREIFTNGSVNPRAFFRRPGSCLSASGPA